MPSAAPNTYAPARRASPKQQDRRLRELRAMTRILLPKLFVTAWFVACFSAPAAENAEASAPDTGFLWQIGVRDNDNS